MSLCVFGLYHILLEHKNAEIGYWLFPEFQGKGFANEALQLVLHFCKNELKLHRIYADVETDNNASNKLLYRNGFLLEGIKQDCEFKNGKFISLQMWAILLN